MRGENIGCGEGDSDPLQLLDSCSQGWRWRTEKTRSYTGMYNVYTSFTSMIVTVLNQGER